MKAIEPQIKNLKLKNVTIVGTPSTISLGLYDFEGINYLNPKGVPSGDNAIALMTSNPRLP